MNRKKLSFKVALGGVIAALSIILMLGAGVTSTLVYAIPMVAGALLMVLVIEFGTGFATAVYVAVSVVSLLVLGNKEAAVMYVGLFGYYPIIKGFLERKLKTVSCWIIKYIIFNVAVVASYVVVTKIFMIPFEDIEGFGKWGLVILLLAGNVVFAMYDVLLTRLVTIYLYKWQKHIKRLFK